VGADGSPNTGPDPPRDTLWDVDRPNAITFDHDGDDIVQAA
jgi:hypothetical protein